MKIQLALVLAVVPLTAAADTTPESLEEQLTLRTSSSEATDERWFTLGLVTGTNGSGARAQVDIIGRAGLSLGLAATALEANTTVMNTQVPTVSGVAYGAYTLPLTNYLHLRGQFGFGMGMAASSDSSSTSMTTGVESTMITEGALLLSLRAGGWGLVAGPIAQFFHSPTTDSDTTTYMMMVGLQRHW